MEEKSNSDSTSPSLDIREEMREGWYPMYVGVSCALFALRLLSSRDLDDDKWSNLCNKMLQGSAHLLGLLVWRAKGGGDEDKWMLLHKLEAAEKKIEELHRIRQEDAKANEKVVGIFAAQEQSWFVERKKLRQHIGALVNDLRVLGKKKDQAVSELTEKLKEMEFLVQSKDRKLEEEELKRKELEENLKKADDVLDELREAAKRAGQEHSTEIWKHKTAFIELVSNQRQLEAEMGRAVRQVEATKQELASVLEQKEESILMVQKLSSEMVKMQKDVEQKDKILSAMLRKSKLDTAERQMLLKEVKLSKAKRKQAELEKERLRYTSESKHGGHSLRSMLANQVSLKFEGLTGARKTHSSAAASSHGGKTRSHSNDLLGYEDPDIGKNESEIYSPVSECYPQEESGTLAVAEDADLENWVHMEAEKYASLIEQRHHLEMEAFAEQMRLKDEKLEVFRWRLLSMDIEAKRLRSHVEGLNKDITQLRHDNMKLEALLLEREEELSCLKEKFASQLTQLNCHNGVTNPSIYDSLLSQGTFWSKVKIIKRRPAEREKKVNTVDESSIEDNAGEMEETSSTAQPRDSNVTAESPDKMSGDQKPVDDGSLIQEESSTSMNASSTGKLSPSSQSSNKTSNIPWRMDLQALGVSYKIKRLNQQLLMLERLTAKQGDNVHSENKEDGNLGTKSFFSLMSLLNKQVNRYQSLQEKIDDLCKRMHENDLDTRGGDSNSSASRTKGEAKTLEHFLEETFQLQRYMVATGQKLMEIQSKVTAGFIGVAEELDQPSSFDMKRFSDNMKTLFQEVQRGLEVRIARIIGDLEGTLASDGITHIRR